MDAAGSGPYGGRMAEPGTPTDRAASATTASERQFALVTGMSAEAARAYVAYLTGFGPSAGGVPRAGTRS